MAIAVRLAPLLMVLAVVDGVQPLYDVADSAVVSLAKVATSSASCPSHDNGPNVGQVPVMPKSDTPSAMFPARRFASPLMVCVPMV